MTKPDYREAACCLNCHYFTSMCRCSRYGGEVDALAVCAGFESRKEVEDVEEK